MKKVITFSALAGLVSCSDDDTNFIPVNFYTDSGYGIRISETCIDNAEPDQQARTFCVTEEVLQSVPDTMQICTPITFNDVDGIERTGLFAGKGIGACSRSANLEL